MQNQQPAQPQITSDMIKNSQDIYCDCGGQMFSEKLTFKKLSAILSPSGKEELIPMPIIVCDACGLVPSAFDPQGIIPKNLKATPTKVFNKGTGTTKMHAVNTTTESKDK